MDHLPEILPFAMPIMGMGIGFVIISSIFLVGPIVKALTRLADAYISNRSTMDQTHVQRLEGRLATLENALERVIEHLDFERALRSGTPHGDVVTADASKSATPATPNV